MTGKEESSFSGDPDKEQGGNRGGRHLVKPNDMVSTAATYVPSDEAMMTRIASCSCGQLRIRCEGEPTKVSLCHCLDCQRRTGSTFGIAAFFDGEMTEAIGASKTYQRASDSGFPVTLHFCGTCGSTVYWYPSRKPDAVAVAVGCFADPAFPAPSQAVYGEYRHEWVVAPASKP